MTREGDEVVQSLRKYGVRPAPRGITPYMVVAVAVLGAVAGACGVARYTEVPDGAGAVLVSLGGLTVAGLSLLLTYQERTRSYRERLYQKQLDVLLDLNRAASDYRYVLLSTRADDENDADRRAEAHNAFLAEFERCIVLIPPSVQTATGALATMGMEVHLDRSNRTDPSVRRRSVSDFVDAWVTWQQAVRDAVGVDRLSDETLQIIAAATRETGTRQ